MKTHKASSTIIIIGTILLMLGIIAATVGFALGGASAVDFGSWRVFSWNGCYGPRLVDRESFQYSAQQSVSQLVVDVAAGEIEIKAFVGGEDGFCWVDVSNYPKDYLKVTEQNGTLRVIDDQKDNWLSWSSWSNPSPKVTIYISGSELERLTVKNGAGDVKITGGPFTVRQDALFDIGAGQLTIQADIIFSSGCNISVGAGDATIASASVQTLEFHVGAGKATFNGEVLSSAKIDVGAGDLSMALSGASSAYYITGSVGVGEVNVFGTRTSFGKVVYGNSSAPVKITLDCGVGNIRITKSER